MRKEVTLWYRQGKDGLWEYNHLEYGHILSRDKPMPNCAEQSKAWANGHWDPQLAWLEDGKVVYDGNH